MEVSLVHNRKTLQWDVVQADVNQNCRLRTVNTRTCKQAGNKIYKQKNSLQTLL